MSWDDFWRAAPPSIQALSIFFTAIFAVISLNAWRSQRLGKRRFEVAEQVILAVYRVKEALDWIRNPGAWEGEVDQRPKSPEEDEDVSRRRDIFYAPIKRIKDTSNEFAELGRAHALCKAHFGDKAAAAVEELFRIRREISDAAWTLINEVGSRLEQQDFQFTQEMRRKIYGTGGDKDALSPRILAAVREIEEVCRPHLK